MRTFSFTGMRIVEGFPVQKDNRFGLIMLLGEEGRGRHFERVVLDRNLPPSVVDGKIIDCRVRKIEPQPGSTKQLRPSYTLEWDSVATDNVLLRINTCGCYTKNTYGTITTLKGSPLTHVSGHGARGKAGRIGGWTDAIVEMRPGDLLKVKFEGGWKTACYAVYLDERLGTPVAEVWSKFENTEALRAAQDAVPDRITGSVRLYRHSTDAFSPGLPVVALPVGIGLQIGWGEQPPSIPFVGFGQCATEVVSAAAGKVGDRFVLHTAEDKEPNTFIVRWQIGPERLGIRVNKLQGEPLNLADGNDDSLWALRPGDAIVSSGVSRMRVVENCDGQPVATPWKRWELTDAAKAPEKYIAQGKAPWREVPAEWVGRIVELQQLDEPTDPNADLSFTTTVKGELVEIREDSLVINVAWQTGDSLNHEITNGVWVVLDKRSSVARPSDTDRVKRDGLKARFTAMTTEMRAAQSEPFADCLPHSLQWQLRSFFQKDLLPETMITFDLEEWTDCAERLTQRLRGDTREAQQLHQDRTAGKVVINFGGHFRRMENFGNCDFWVVLPDGGLRSPDRIDWRGYNTCEGKKFWNWVGGGELALSWNGGTDFAVNLRPAELTRAQLDAVARIEIEDLRVTPGSFGLNAEANRA